MVKSVSTYVPSQLSALLERRTHSTILLSIRQNSLSCSNPKAGTKYSSLCPAGGVPGLHRTERARGYAILRGTTATGQVYWATTQFIETGWRPSPPTISFPGERATIIHNLHLWKQWEHGTWNNGNIWTMWKWEHLNNGKTLFCHNGITCHYLPFGRCQTELSMGFLVF